MPEGDTLHKVAAAMRPELLGQAVRRVCLRERGEVPGLGGQRVRAVGAIGKHLVVAFDGGAALRVHLGMKGKWRRFRPGQAWDRPRGSATVVIETEEAVLVCFRGAQAELTRRRDPRLAALGPDLLGDEPDWDALVSRVRARCPPTRSIGEALLDQRLAAGIGNVYRSEVLFVEGLHPRTPVGDVDDAALASLYRRARELMARNVGGGRRTTVPGARDRAPRSARLWTYRRAGRGCRRCGTPIAHERLGDQARSVYCCPRCQPAPETLAPARTSG